MEDQDLLNQTRFHRYPWSWVDSDGLPGLPEEHQTFDFKELHLYFDALLTQGRVQKGGWVRIPEHLMGATMGLDFILAHPSIESCNFVVAKAQDTAGLKAYSGETHIALGLLSLYQRPKEMDDIPSITLDLELIDLDSLRLLAGRCSNCGVAPDGFVYYLANQTSDNMPEQEYNRYRNIFSTQRILERLKPSETSVLVARYLRDVIVPRCEDILDLTTIEGLPAQIENHFRYGAKAAVSDFAAIDEMQEFPGLHKNLG